MWIVLQLASFLNLAMSLGDFSVSSEVAQSCPTLCDPMDCSLPGSSVHRIIQARYWSGLPFPSPGDLPNPGIEPWSPTVQAGALPSVGSNSF